MQVVILCDFTGEMIAVILHLELNKLRIMGKKLRIISRQSALALLQVEEVQKILPKQIEYEVIKTSSFGDNHKEISLMEPSLAADFFTRELDNAILEHRADIGIHSAKALPYPLPAGIEIIALTKAENKSDSLVAKDNHTLKSLPKHSKVGTSSAQRKAELLALRPDLDVVPIRGTIEERIEQVNNGSIDALIVATCALDRLGLRHLASEELPFKTHPLQGNLAVTASSDVEPWIREIFTPLDIRKSYGKVKLVGFGPGDPELITIKGNKALEEASIIFFDDLTNEDYLQRFSAEKIYVGKRSGKHSHSQDAINELLYQAAISGKQVVRLKGGDPMVFAHGREEIDFLKSRMVEVEVIPGISSGNALASLTQIPLTHRGVARSVAFVLGHSASPLTPDSDTLVYYMGGSEISAIASSLLKQGRERQTPVALVTNVSLPNQREIYSTLEELQYAVFRDSPVLVVVGEVVHFSTREYREKIYDTSSTSSTPLITISKNEVALPDTKDFDFIVFTSRYGVKYFDKPLDGTKIISVGPTTTEALKQRGATPIFESPTESAEGIIKWFKDKKKSKILLPRSDKGLKTLSEKLVEQGYEVTDLPVYTNKPNREAVKQDLTKFDKVLFTSPSTVEAFKQLYGENISKHLLFIAKGKTTYEAVQTIQTI